MPLLMPDVAHAWAESSRRAASAVDEEIRRVEALRERVDALRQTTSAWEALGRRTLREARSATQNLLADAREAMTMWSAAIADLGKDLPKDEQIALLESFADLAGSLQGLRHAVERLWSLVRQMGNTVEGTNDLGEAGRLSEQIRHEASRALEMRSNSWQPSEPNRLQQGMDEIRSGKALTPDQARAFFRQS